MPRLPRISLLLLLPLMMAGCSGPRHKGPPLSEDLFQLRVWITDNHSKMFVLMRSQPPRSGGAKAPAPRAVGDPPRRGGQNGPQRGRGPDSGKDLRAILDLKLSAVSYCREGYFILEENHSQDLTSLKGECRDGATPEDRQNFPDTRPLLPAS